MDDLFTPLTPPNPAAVVPKCRRHEWVKVWPLPDSEPHSECLRCGTVRDEAKARMGRNNKKRGGRIQKARIEGLGGVNLLGNKPNHDGTGLAFSYESKSGGFFSERVWRVLRGIPATAQQTRVLIVTSTDGPGHKARSYVVVDYDQWRDLHGETA